MQPETLRHLNRAKRDLRWWLLQVPQNEMSDDEVELMWILSFPPQTREAILKRGKEVDAKEEACVRTS